MNHTKNNRRKFLKKISLTAASIGTAPALIAAGCKSKKKTTDPNCPATTEDYYGQGPFYTPNPPDIIDGQLANVNEPGTRLILSGQVKTLDCSQVISGAEIDIWHANENGDYDNSGGYHLRGKTYSDAQGNYMFETIMPGKYLNGNTHRPAHIHFRITVPGYPTLITQLYFSGDSSIATDPAASIESGNYDATHRTIDLITNNQGHQIGNWDIIIEGDGAEPMGKHSIYQNKGMIYGVSPNPITNHQTFQIQYGVYQKGRVMLNLYDSQANLIETLLDKTQDKGKYKHECKSKRQYSPGHYYLSFQLNDVQVHHLKLVIK